MGRIAKETFVNHLQYWRLLEEKVERVEIKRCAVKFIMWKEALYKFRVYLRCKGQIQDAIKDVHACVRGPSKGIKLQMQSKRLGYYWPTKILDCIECAKDAIFGSFTRILFINPENLCMSLHVMFGVPNSIIIDNGQPFRRYPLYRLFAKYKIKHNHCSWSYAYANGMVEAFNQTLSKMFKKMMSEAEKSKDDWLSLTIQALKKASPTSLKISLRSIREGRLESVGQCLVREYRMVCSVMRGKVSKDFFEVALTTVGVLKVEHAADIPHQTFNFKVDGQIPKK
ncbi:hypothetical protein RJ639_034440 [Escallonia herrerae]|uniref:3-hydroxyisobutyryl-CoA hydrolase n=1 Tax=Escallonia herrerae TaxID=1293975 RepID=A0AA88X4F5_9ASTE|nr:hypothetical protein RJ639_034440 [Escallonia herrerae]